MVLTLVKTHWAAHAYTAPMRNSPSLTTKLLAMGAGFLLVALSSIGLTLWVTWKLEGGAAAVNEAGRQCWCHVLPSPAPRPQLVADGQPLHGSVLHALVLWVVVLLAQQQHLGGQYGAQHQGPLLPLGHRRALGATCQGQAHQQGQRGAARGKREERQTEGHGMHAQMLSGCFGGCAGVWS